MDAHDCFFHDFVSSQKPNDYYLKIANINAHPEAQFHFAEWLAKSCVITRMQPALASTYQGETGVVSECLCDQAQCLVFSISSNGMSMLFLLVQLTYHVTSQ